MEGKTMIPCKVTQRPGQAPTITVDMTSPEVQKALTSHMGGHSTLLRLDIVLHTKDGEERQTTVCVDVGNSTYPGRSAIVTTETCDMVHTRRRFFVHGSNATHPPPQAPTVSL